ncbi:hypothetical protein [Streptomyces syringium]|uniref:hypothetical protein n=1 Tax=Streptomyces syringium TaxID=76729 RepID=UPI00339F0ECA
MGSLRNPIGPLPSSIYWRRRAVALGLLGLLVLLVLWAVLGGGGGSDGDRSNGSNGKGPGDTTITPGPTPSGPHISQRPGGRDESGNGGAGGGDHGGAGSSGSAGTGTGGGAGGSGGSGAGGGLSTGDGKAVPAGSNLPDCASGSVQVSVRSVKDAYKPDEKPKFEFVVKNTGSSACKVDFGSAAANLKIVKSEGSDHVWASDDCARSGAPVLLELPGSGEIKSTLEWDRKRSAPRCATPSGSLTAEPGTYKVEVKIAGVTETVNFTLEKA